MKPTNDDIAGFGAVKFLLASPLNTLLISRAYKNW